MTFEQALDYLQSRVNYENLTGYKTQKVFKLQRMKDLVQRLGHPERQVPCLHVAGSQGKGSTCALTYSILKAAGYRVGLYTSPHLSSFLERFRVSNTGSSPFGSPSADSDETLSEKDFARIVSGLAPEINAYEQTLGAGEKLTFFEVTTLVAFKYFAERRLDVALYEVGLGGRLDSTNVVEPVACGITRISREHVKALGFSLIRIGTEKLGIVKPGVPVVTSPQWKSVAKLTQQIAEAQNAPLYWVGQDIKTESLAMTQNAQTFRVKGLDADYGTLRMPLLGEHQAENAGVAIGLAELFARFKKKPLGVRAVIKGVQEVQWPGRMEVWAGPPRIILDTAHTVVGVTALRKAVSRMPGTRRIVLVLGICRDKLVRQICQSLVPAASAIVLTQPNNPRALSVGELADNLPSSRIPVRIRESVPEALEEALSVARNYGEDTTILVTGSIFVVGEARDWLKESFPIPERAAHWS
ncbi:MAG: bifunctional folylpolyglutamate synthase/dihydrofolate synthase [Candidatus Omnitrophica bacterium]|nr:bifunctional folylpolyglutamate synthase/dihydrofolate synthase [Candidatus Omnitrophota bacterium]